MLYCISLSTSCRLAFQPERRHQGSSLTHPALHYHHQQPCSGAAREEGPAAPSPGRLWSWLHVEQPSPARSLSLAETASPEAHHEPGILRVQLGGVVAMRPWRKECHWVSGNMNSTDWTSLLEAPRVIIQCQASSELDKPVTCICQVCVMKQQPGRTQRGLELAGQEVSPLTYFFEKERKVSSFQDHSHSSPPLLEIL